MVDAMKTADAPSLSDRVDHFLRWFFTATPEAVEPWQPSPAKPRRRTVAQRKPTRLRPQHSKPARLAAKGKP
jgi:hypothetical protein